MKQKQFWQEVDRRVSENQAIVAGGMTPRLARPLVEVGLHFWKVGIALSLGISLWLWWRFSELLIQVTRVMVWR
jgi:hypothetical protein